MAILNMEGYTPGMSFSDVSKTPVSKINLDEMYPPTQPTAEQQKLAKMGGWERGVEGAKQRGRDLGRGVSQLVRAGSEYTTQTPEEKRWSEALAKDKEASLGSGAVDLGIGALPIGRGLRAGMGVGAGVGLIEPADTAGDRLRNVAVNSVLGGVGGKIGDVGANIVGRGINRAKGNYATPDIEKRLALFEKNKMPYTLGDITRTPSTMATENSAQWAGMGGNLQPRQAARLKEIVDAAPDSVLGSSATKGDITQTVEKSIKDSYKAKKDTISNEFTRLKNEATSISGKSPVMDASPIAAEIKALEDTYGPVFGDLSGNKKMQSLVERIKGGITEQQSPILGASGVPFAKPAQATYDELYDLRAELGRVARRAEKLSNTGNADAQIAPLVRKIQDSIDTTGENWAASVGRDDIAEGLSNARKAFATEVMPYRNNPTTRSILNGTFQPKQEENLVSTMFKLDSPTLTSESMKLMTPEGVEAVKQHFVRKAATEARPLNMTGEYMPERFLSNTNFGETGPLLYSPDELARIGNIQEIIQANPRAYEYSLNSNKGTVDGKSHNWWNMPSDYIINPALSKVYGNQAATKYFASNPALFPDAGPLGRYSETMMRNLGRGSMLDDGGALKAMWNDYQSVPEPEKNP